MRRRVGAIVAGLITAVAVLPAVSNAEDKADDKQECLAASEQGQNLRDDGLYRTARESFLKCSRDACPKVIVQSCTRWLRELDQDAPTVVLGAKDGQGNDLTDVTVLLDGKPFATLLDGKPLESDAGEHVLRFERNGSAPAEQKLVLRAGEKARVVTVTLRSLNAEGSSTEPEAPKPVVVAEVEPPPESFFSSHHVTAGALLIGAVAAGAAGAVFLVASGQDKNSAASLRANLASDSCTHASTSTCQSLSDKVTSQHQDMNIATGLFAGAGLLAVGGIVAWLVWPHSDPSQPAPQASVVPVLGGGVFQVAGGF